MARNSLTETPTPQTNVASEETGLLPCPHCGSKAYLQARLDTPQEPVWRIICIEMGCFNSCTVGFNTCADAIRRWNMRVPLISSGDKQPKETGEQKENP